jgi:hypothetical protein
MSTVRDAVNRFVLRVRESGIRGASGPAVRSLLGPFFVRLGYEGADPRVDSLLTLGGLAVAVDEEAGAGTAALATAFAANPGLTLGIAIGGARWRFFTDLVEPHVLDQEPFACWDMVADDVPPLDLLALMQKSHFSRASIHALAREERAERLLLGAITNLLGPSPEFTRLVVASVEPEAVFEAAVDRWKPAVARALRVWAKQQTQTPLSVTSGDVTEQDLKAFEVIRSLLGADKAIAFEDAGAYFKIHLAEKATWVFVRLLLDHDKPQVQVPLPVDQVMRLANGLPVSTPGPNGWTAVDFESTADMGQLGDLFRAAYQAVKHVRMAC